MYLRGQFCTHYSK
uniref:Uncharacterized protein n=1 Tax=Arundo donax TaxID=35708 RepID=A0A0A9CE41_ARUDO